MKNTIGSYGNSRIPVIRSRRVQALGELTAEIASVAMIYIGKIPNYNIHNNALSLLTMVMMVIALSRKIDKNIKGIEDSVFKLINSDGKDAPNYILSCPNHKAEDMQIMTLGHMAQSITQSSHIETALKPTEIIDISSALLVRFYYNCEYYIPRLITPILDFSLKRKYSPIVRAANTMLIFNNFKELQERLGREPKPVML